MNFIEDAKYDLDIHHVLFKISEKAASLYVTLNLILKSKPPCYQMLAAHCVREIISFIIKTKFKKGDDWAPSLLEEAKNFDDNNVQLEDNYKQCLNKLLKSYEDKQKRKNKLKAVLMDTQKGMTEHSAEALSSKITKLEFHKYAHTGVDDDSGNLKFEQLIESFEKLIKLIGNSFSADNRLVCDLLKKEPSVEVFEEIRLHLKYASLEFDFYNEFITGKIEWFDILSGAGIFDMKNFCPVKSSEERISMPNWNPFYYLISIFDDAPDKVIPIFQKMIEQNCRLKGFFEFHRYCNQIFEKLDTAKVKNRYVKNVIKPISIIRPQKGSFFVFSNLFKIIDNLLEKDSSDRIAYDVLKGVFRISIRKNDTNKALEFVSWENYQFFVEKIEETGFFDRHTFILLCVFLDLLEELYSREKALKVYDGYGSDYILGRTDYYSNLPEYIVYLLFKYIPKLMGDDIHLFRDKIRSFESCDIKLYKKLMCYFSLCFDSICEIHDVLLECSDMPVCEYFGTSDYTMLVLQKFDDLSREQKLNILQEREKIYQKSLSDDEFPEIKRSVINYFLPFSGKLIGEYYDKYSEYLSGVDIEYLFDKRSDSEFKTYSVGVNTLHSAKEFSKMPFENIFNICKTFKEEPDADFMDKPTLTGTFSNIAKALYGNTEGFWDNLKFFMNNEVHPEIHFHLISNLDVEKIVLDDTKIDILLSYFEWIIEQNYEYKDSFKSEDAFLLRSNYYQTWKSIASVVGKLKSYSGLDNTSIERVKNILLFFLKSPDNHSNDIDDRGDYYGIAINSLWGESLTSFLRLSFSLVDNGKNVDVEDVLIDLIKRKNKLINSIFGRYYPWLNKLFLKKYEIFQSMLFDKSDTELYRAWFIAYLYNASVNKKVFDELAVEYLFAATTLLKEKQYNKEKLAQHLGLLYYNREIIPNRDDLGSILFSDDELLSKAMNWIVRLPKNCDASKLNIENIKMCVEEFFSYIAPRKGITAWNNFRLIFENMVHIYTADVFEKDWSLPLMIQAARNAPTFVYAEELLNVVAKEIDVKERRKDTISIFEHFLVKDEYIDRENPQSYKCPYYIYEEKVNMLFEKLLHIKSSLNEAELASINNVIGNLCLYGYRNQIKQYIGAF